MTGGNHCGRCPEIRTLGGIKGLSYLNLRLEYDECKMNINNVTVADDHHALLAYISNLNPNLKTAYQSSS